MAAVFWSLTSAEVGHRAFVEGWSGLGARCSGLERDESSCGGEDLPVRRAAAVSLGAARSSSSRRALRRRKEDWDGPGSFEVVREVKSGAQTRWPTRGSGADEHSRRYGRRTHRVEHSTGTGEAQ